MEITINTLQKGINERAAAKLDADLKKVSEFIRGNRLISIIGDQFPSLTYNDNTNTPYFLFQYESDHFGYIESSPYMNQIRAYWLPIYIKEETEDFLSLAYSNVKKNEPIPKEGEKE